MGMPITDKKEALGQAYVRAIVAKAGYNIAHSEKDFGLDGTIKDVTPKNGRYHETGFTIEYQLKSSCNVTFENEELVYDLESKNYNDLAEWDGNCPGILILFVLPEKEDEWISFGNDGLLIRRCAWWYCPKGQPATDNTSTKRIRIPKTQVFSPETLEMLMEKVKRGEAL